MTSADTFPGLPRLRDAFASAVGDPNVAVTSLARQSGVGRSTLFSWMSGAVAPTAAAWKCVAQTLNVDPVQLWRDAGGVPHNEVWEARMRKGWSSGCLAVRAHVSKRTVHNAEHGSKIRSDAAARIARALDDPSLMEVMSGGVSAASKVGEILERDRIDRGMSRREYANTLGVSRQLLSAWLNGVETLPAPRVPQVAGHTGVDAAALLRARELDCKSRLVPAA